MKFKKDGKVFEGIEKAHDAFKCPGLCSVDCPLNRPSWAYGRVTGGTHICDEYVGSHPIEAARLMGYEVVEEETGWTLAEDGDGVVCPHCGADFCTLVYNAEEFIFCPSCGKKVKKEASIDKRKPLKDWTMGEAQEYCAARNGNCADDCALSNKGLGIVCKVSLKPVGWNLAEKPRFTEQEVADARVLMKAWPYGQLKRDGCDDLYFFPYPIRKTVSINPEMFPSIQTGEIVALDNIVGGDTE